MTAVSNLQQAHAVDEPLQTPTSEQFALLEQFSDETGHAVSFYFKPAPGRDAELDLLALRIKARDMFSRDFEAGRKSTGLLRDLDGCLEAAEMAAEGDDAPLKVVFACHDRGIWLEYELPSRARLLRMEAGRKFNLEPLFRRLSAAA